MAHREITEEELTRDRMAVDNEPMAYASEAAELVGEIFSKKFEACTKCVLSECRLDNDTRVEKRCKVFKIIGILLQQERDYLMGNGPNPCNGQGGFMMRGRYK